MGAQTRACCTTGSTRTVEEIALPGLCPRTCGDSISFSRWCVVRPCGAFPWSTTAVWRSAKQWRSRTHPRPTMPPPDASAARPQLRRLPAESLWTASLVPRAARGQAQFQSYMALIRRLRWPHRGHGAPYARRARAYLVAARRAPWPLGAASVAQRLGRDGHARQCWHEADEILAKDQHDRL